jgi:polyhydroxyalkanoate synthesis regulator phasin
MTQVETARINELIGLQIGAIQEDAQRLDVNSDLQELEANVATLEKRIADLKASLVGIPHDHP